MIYLVLIMKTMFMTEVVIFDHSPLPSNYDEKIRFIDLQIRRTRNANLTRRDFTDTIRFWKKGRAIEISNEFYP